MSVDNVRRLLGSLLDDPENANAWATLEELAAGDELGQAGDEGRALLGETRRKLHERGEAEAVASMLSVESAVAPDAATRGALLRERARYLEEELLDDKSALATLDSILSGGDDAEAAEMRERLNSKKARWKDITGAFKKNAEEGSTDPAVVASHLVSAAAVVLQYKPKGREKEADAIFESALSIDPGNLRAAQLFERVLRRRGGRWDDLAAHLERAAEAVEPVSAKVDLLFRAARTHAARRNDIAAAERLYRRILELDPGNGPARRFVVAILTERERWDDLADFYEAQIGARAEDGADIGLLVQAGMTHWRVRNDPARAEPFFRRLRDVSPEHPAVRAFFEANEAPSASPSPEPEATAPETADATSEAPETMPSPEPASEEHEDVHLSAHADEEIDAPDEGVQEPVVAAATEPVTPTVPPPAPVAAEVLRPTVPSAPPAPSLSTTPSSSNPRLLQAIEAARAAESAGQPDKAIEAWKMALRLDAQGTDARHSLARLYAATGRWNNLVELLRQELESLGGVRPGTDLTANRERKAEILREMVDIYRDRLSLEPMVVQTYNALLLLEPGDVPSLVALSESYERLGRWTDVIKVLDQQVEHTDDPAAKITLLRRVAKLWVERFNNVNNATRPLEQIVALDPTDADALAQLKDLYTRRRAWRPLFDVSRREAERLTGDARRDALVELAKLAAEKLGANVDAIGLWREALALDPKTPGALDALEKLTERERDFDGLAQVIEQRARETDDAEQKVALLMKLGAVYGDRIGDAERSIDAWRRVLQVQPKHAKALRVLRDVYIQAGHWDRLEALYEEAGDLEGLAEVLGSSADRATNPPDRVALSFRAAKVYEERLRQPARAFRSYERVLSVDPNNVAAATALVPIYLEDERWSRLAQLYEVLLNAVPADDRSAALSYLHKLREISASRLGDRAAAFQWALRAYRLEPTDSSLEAQVEASAAEAGAWRELVDTFDARAASAADPLEIARLRDKSAAVEADRLGEVDAAISRYERALAQSPDDASVMHSLDALLRRAQRWDDLRGLFDHRVARVSDAAERRALITEVAELEEAVLQQPDAASERFRVLIATDPTDETALAALSRLAESAGRWAELESTLSARHDLAQGAARAELALALGSVQRKHLGKVESAIEAYREVLALSAHHQGALDALESLLGDERWRVVAAKTLEPEFEQTGEFRKLAWVLQILFDVEQDADRRRELGLRLARVYSERLDDPRSGFDLLRSMLDAEPASEPIANAVTALSIEGGWTTELAGFLATLVAREGVDPAVRVGLARRTAALHEDRNGDPAAAEPFHRVVIEGGAPEPGAFESLERLYRQSGRWSDLHTLYGTWVERLTDDGARVALFIEEGRLLEDVLDQPEDAVGALERAVALDPANAEVSSALDRLYERLGRWESLVTLLSRSIEQGRGADETTELRLRRAETLELKLARVDDAFVDYETVVESDATNARARRGLERLIEAPALRQRAAQVLETLYDRDGDPSAEGLVRMLQIRLEATEPGAPRAALHQRIAELREIVLHDPVGALDAIATATLEDPTQATFREELLRLSAVALQDARAAETLEEVLEDPRASTVRVPVLRDLAAIYDERLIDPVKAERTFRRLLTEAEGDRDTTLAAAVALERLYRALQNPRGLVDALRLRARHETDPALQTSLLSQAAEILEDEVGDLAGAIEAQRGRLDLDAGDLDALRALARLYERSGQWEELVTTLRRQAALVGDGDAQKQLLVRAASVLEEKLAAVPEAIALYEEVLSSFGPDRAIHAALARLLEVSDQWAGLLAVVERDLAVAEDPADRLALIVRAADLRYRKTDEPLMAVLGYQEALSLDPTTPAARLALTEMLRSSSPDVPIAAARALEPVLRADGDWAKLVDVLDRIAAESDDRDERLQSLSSAAEVAEVGLSDSGRAFERASRALSLAAEDADAAQRVAHVESLARAAGRHKELIAVFREVAPKLLDAELQRDVLMRIADTALTNLNDTATAREHFEKALENQADFAPALDALESLHESTQQWDELLSVLRRKVELADSDAARRALLHKVARIQEERRDDRAGAVEAYEAILGSGFDAESATALERLYARAGRWDDLANLLESQLTRDGADTAALHHRLGRVAMDHLDDTERAFEHFRAVLDQTGDHEATVAALEELGQRPELAARVATMLEPIYRSRMDMPKLIGALESRIAAEDDPRGRIELLSRLATLYEENIGDLGRALDTQARIFREDPADRATWETLDRLARATDAHPKLAEVYASALDGIAVDDDSSADLSFAAARLFDERVQDTARARRFYRRTLAFDGGRREVFDALEALLARESAHAELLDLYRDAAERAVDPIERKAFLHKIAAIDEGPLGNLERAIADYRAVLDVDPMDADAIHRLDALLVKTQAWRDLADLLERRIADAVDVEERSALRFRLGRLRADQLGDPTGAVDAFREILEDRRDHRVAIQSLEQLAESRPELRLSVVEILEPVYRELDDWARLAGVLVTRLEATHDAAGRAELYKEIGRIRETRARDPKLAFEAFSAAFGVDPGDGEARESVERLAGEHGLWDELVRSYEAALASSDDLVLKSDLLRAIAATHDQRRGDPRAAISAYERLFSVDETQLDVLDQLEGLHVLLSDWEGHVDVLERKVARSLDDDHRRFLLHTVGESQRDMLNNPTAAIHAFRRALEIDPTDLVALEALDGLLSQRGDHRGLAEVLQQRLDVESDPAARTDTALRLGRLWERSLEDPHHAIDAYRRALDESPSQAEAIRALERLFAAQSMFPELLENLRMQVALASSPADRSALLLRIGALQQKELGDSDAALDSYREVLAAEPTNPEALTAVREISQDVDQRVAAVEILEPLYRGAGRWDDLVQVLEHRIECIDDPAQRASERRRIAAVHEDGRKDHAAAFESYLLAFSEDSGEPSTLAELERLAASLGRWTDLVSALERAVRDGSDPSAGRDLSVRAARISVERIEDDTRAAHNYRQALELGGDDDTVLEALDQIYSRSAQWNELGDILERRVLLSSPDRLDALEVRLAELRMTRFADARGAVSALQNVVEREPTHARAIELLEKLLDDPTVRDDAMEVLEQTFRRSDNATRQAWLLGLKVDAATSDADRVQILGDLARLREERMSDLSGALDAVTRAFALDPRDEGLLGELERLAPAANAWPSLRGVIESAVRPETGLVSDEAVRLNLRGAKWYADHIGDAAAAEARVRAALEADPESVEALTMLEGLQRQPGREADLVATLRRRAEVEFDGDARKAMLREAATLAEGPLGNVDLAAEISAATLEVDDADPTSIDDLARLRRMQGRWEDLADLLGRRARLADDPTEALRLRREVAGLYAGPLADETRAVTAWREVLDFDPSDLDARVALESLFERSGKWRDLEDALRGRLDVAVSVEERVATRLRLADVAEQQLHSAESAVEYLREILDEVPEHPAAGAALERLYASLNRWSDLSDLLEHRLDHAVSMGDSATELTTLVRIGELHEQRLNDVDRAIELYERVLDRQPEHSGALAAVARLAEASGDYEKATSMLQRAVAVAPPGVESAAMALRLATLQADRLNDPSAAEQSLRRALELDPSSTESLRRLRALAESRRDHTLLAEVMEKELALTSDVAAQVTLLRGLATLSRDQLADPARAMAYLERASALNPSDREVLLPLVDLLSANGREADAVPILEKIIASFAGRRTKELAQWQHRLGQAQQRMGNKLEALSLYDAAFKIDLTSVPILRDLGLLCLETGDLDRAQKTFRALLLQRLDPNVGLTKADVYAYLGETLSLQGDKPKAIGMLERALESDRQHPRATTLLAQLRA
ncbi:MAG: tetratricopeptide repeat protein [Myxococcaceae bacterium]|nr:MAG: tetratricopeptide repeat protein [Myxococcaceae bacterium]